MVQKMGRKAIDIFLDSRLVVSQAKGELKARDLRMQEYLNQVRRLQSRFESFSLLHIPMNGNTHADSLATFATSSAQGLPWVILVEDLCKPTEGKSEIFHIHQIRVGPSWIDPIMLFLKEDILPEDKSKADKVQGSSVLAIWRSKIVQMLFLRAVLVMHTPWGIRATSRGVTWRDLWKPHKKQILVS